MTLYPPAVDYHLLRPAPHFPRSPCTTPADQADMMLTPRAVDVWAETISVTVPISISLKSLSSCTNYFQCKLLMRKLPGSSFLQTTVEYLLQEEPSFFKYSNLKVFIFCKRSHLSSIIPTIWKCSLQFEWVQLWSALQRSPSHRISKGRGNL